MVRFYETPHNYRGRLIIVEGIDGSGKSTQLQLMHKWLLNRGYDVFVTEWNSSVLVKNTIKRSKKQNILTPTTFRILHAADFSDRLCNLIIPPIKAGMIVLADRYIYTAFCRDTVRGVRPEWVRDLYGFALKPDIAFYFKVPIEVSIERVISARTKIKYYEAGMDLGLSNDIVECFKLFQGRVLVEYDRVAKEFQLDVIDGTAPIEKQQQIVREIIDRQLNGNQAYPASNEGRK